MSWDSVYNTFRDFIYNYTELAIWIGLLLLVITLFWMMVYSISFRRNMTVILILAALAVWGAVEYGLIEWPAPATENAQPA
jgi:hypothetical protein